MQVRLEQSVNVHPGAHVSAVSNMAECRVLVVRLTRSDSVPEIHPGCDIGEIVDRGQIRSELLRDRKGAQCYGLQQELGNVRSGNISGREATEQSLGSNSVVELRSSKPAQATQFRAGSQRCLLRC